jgi:cytochrome b561
MNFSAPNRYTRTAIALHWLIALLIIANFALGLTMADMALSPQKLKFFSWHKWVGVTIFMLVCLRLLWRLAHAAPPLPASMPAWQAKAAHMSHLLLYVLMFAIPLSGWLYSSAAGKTVVYLGLIPLPDLVHADKALAEVLKEVHEYLNFILAAFVVMHIAAAWKHHLVDRDDVLTRMLPFLSKKQG